ncbi:hypothetical protein CPB86DRAFT_698462 [Serendipita vermifera]|nr:hypothetical protein CPB86DRAFT_698462 [Serendipita vermifera]
MSQLLGLGKSIQTLDEHVKDFGSWKFLLSGDSVRYLRHISRKDAHMFEVVYTKMRDLSTGNLFNDNHKRLAGTQTEVPVFEAKITSDTRLIYMIDCVLDNTGEVFIKMFGIYTDAQMDNRLWAAVAASSSRRGREYRKRCQLRQKNNDTGHYEPESWPPVQEVYEAEASLELNDHDTMIRVSTRPLRHEKSIPLTQSVFDSIVFDDASTFPFSPSHREHQVIYHPSSCFVIGRSGTGKTTTMLLKMLAIEKASRQMGLPKVRQAFVTQSGVLAEKVQEYFKDLLRSSIRSLGHLKEPTAEPIKPKESERGLVRRDDEEDDCRLPSRFSQLKDEHFPLFLTFDKLCKLLEADIRESKGQFRANFQHKRTKSSNNRRFSLSSSETANFQTSISKILYEDFLSKYWPQLPQSATKGFDPALVWNEIQGVICGSEASLEEPRGFLDRDCYERLSVRKHAAFASHRSRLYDVFEGYNRLKRRKFESDAADRSHSLLNELKEYQLSTSLDYIYVDEVQDNLLIDAKLLRSLCHNPHGFFWAGDTAQQITSTAFRFSDLKAFLYRIERRDPLVVAQRRPAIHPEAFTLSINYRSHSGITDCAHSIIRLLTSLWPDSVDILEREYGLVQGPKPSFFSGWQRDSINCETFLFGKEERRIEFGAEQCVLVRNEAVKRDLRQKIGDIGLILTLYESKGLEFNDVLLYNFFEHSTMDTEWRVVLNSVNHLKNKGLAAPAFDELRHLGICSELKFLYVGVTRARNRLWIWDYSDKADYMKTFWKSLALIDIVEPGDPIPHLAVVSSTKEQWRKKGQDFFDRHNYDQAMHCFRRADSKLEYNVCDGYHRLQKAEILDTENPSRRRLFLEAAKIFLQCAKEIPTPGTKRSYYKTAGKCLAEGGNYLKASKAFYLAMEYTLAAQYARKGGDFDGALEITDNHSVDPVVASLIRQVCGIEYMRGNAFEKARRLYPNQGEYLKQFDVFGLDKTDALIDLGLFEEAADNLTGPENNIRAIELYLQAKTPSSRDKASKILLDEWWSMLPCSPVLQIHGNVSIERLIRYSNRIDPIPKGFKEELEMFESIVKDDEMHLLHLSGVFIRKKNTVAALRCYFHVFQKQPDLQEYMFEQMHSRNHHLQCFGSLLRSSLCMDRVRFQASELTQKLLGYRPCGPLAREAIVQKSSDLNTRLVGNGLKTKNQHGNLILSVGKLERMAHDLLGEYSKQIITTHSTACKQARIFRSICIKSTVGNCSQDPCSNLHLDLKDRRSILNDRFRITLHQIIVINNMDFILSRTSRVKMRLYWITRLFEVIYPQSLMLGQKEGLQADYIHPEQVVLQGLRVLREWIEDCFYNLGHWYQGFANALTKLFLLGSVIDYDGIPRYIRRAKIERRIMSNEYRKDKDGNSSHPLFLDIYNSLFAQTAGAMECGVEYLKHMIESNTLVDAFGLILILEEVTILLLGGLKPTLNTLIIPNSWLFRLKQRRTWADVGVLAYISHLLNPLLKLLAGIDSGSPHLQLEGKAMRETSPATRSSLMERILRCLILCGWNTDKLFVRQLIGSRLASLGDTETHSGTILWRYTEARTWEELVSLMMNSSSTKSDEIVLLVHKDSKTITDDFGARVIHFNDIPSILSAFDSSPLLSLPYNNHRATKSNWHLGDEGISTTAELFEERTQEQPQQLPGNQVVDPSQLITSFTDAESDAAKLIEAIYQRYRRRMAARSKEGRLDYWYNICRKQSAHLGCSRSYRLIYLGPFPHLLLCLDSFREDLERQRSQLSHSLQFGDHLELEKHVEELKALESIRDQLDGISTKLDPESRVHYSGNMWELKDHAKIAFSLMKEFCMMRTDLSDHFEAAYKAIITSSSKTKPKPKPILNTSDL